jgi:hypothetical protein
MRVRLKFTVRAVVYVMKLTSTGSVSVKTDNVAVVVPVLERLMV